VLLADMIYAVGSSRSTGGDIFIPYCATMPVINFVIPSASKALPVGVCTYRPQRSGVASLALCHFRRGSLPLYMGRVGVSS
jgi:hypothetical protein